MVETSDVECGRELPLPAEVCNPTAAGNISTLAFDYYRHLSRVRDYVRTHCRERIRLGDIAGSTGLSASHLSRLFREKTGQCLSDWLRDQRVSKAEEMLIANDLSISAIAYSCGFQNPRTFERAFKKKNGISPREFRKIRAPQFLSHIDQ